MDSISARTDIINGLQQLICRARALPTDPDGAWRSQCAFIDPVAADPDRPLVLIA
jgi:hypothetical protein